MSHIRCIATILVFGCLGGFAQGDDARAHRILELHCLQCHDVVEAKGGLSLETREAALTGGDSGPSIRIDKPEDSPLLQAVSGDQPEMPKGAAPLSPEDRQTLREWIVQGAKWPSAPLKDRRAEATDWWSFQPLVRPAVPQSHGATTVTNPVDAFLGQALSSQGLSPSPQADRATLIRRLSFDLVGLPPTPEQLLEFEQDNLPGAYERLVNRLLDHPGYGERWARHWLDVVHFGETHGYDKDKPRPNAWPYRDYLIRAFNEDRPYSRFIEEQLAGDILYPGTADGIEALGFISAGPWDFIGHAEVPETKIDGKVARHLDRDDMVTNTIQTFCSLTVQCAQCHNHKFDPISQQDYYALQAVFAAVDRTDRPYDKDPDVARKRSQWSGELQQTMVAIEQLENTVRSRAGEPLKLLTQRIAELEKQAATAAGQYPVEFGWHSGIEPRADVEKWVQVDLNQSTEISEVVLRPCHDDFGGIGDGFGFPPAFRVQIADDMAFTQNVRTLTEKTIANPKLTPVRIPVKLQTARAVRVTATQLAARQNDFIFSLAELEVIGPSGTNLARGAAVSSLDSIEAGPRWGRKNLTDGLFPGARADVAEPLAKAQADLAALWTATMTPDEQAAFAKLATSRDSLKASLAGLPAQSVAYIGAVHTGGGAFTGTGANGGKPRPIHRLTRGNVTQPLEEVGPGALTAVTNLSARFELPSDHPEGQRRAALSRWIAAPQNPLTWRSAANRIWQHHFGRGMVETPNDFGRNGAQPSHPQLLDWLACDLREHQSLKQLHRTIVLSAAYRQVSADDPAKSKLDGDNRFLWRMNRRRLEAEPLRDAVLATSGLLDSTMYGPSFQDFVVEHPEHSPHYEYRLHDPRDTKCFRRSVYRFLVRSQPEPFMASLDCADPSMQVDRRNESVSPLQALSLWNDAFMLTTAKIAQEHAQETKSSLEDQVSRAWVHCFSRPISQADRTTLTALAREHGMSAVWRVLWNSNRFVFVE